MALLDWLSTLANARTGAPSTFKPAKTKILNDPFYRFQSLEEIEIAASLGVQIDVNQASSLDDWLRLPGISIHQARVLAELVQSGVQFHCLEDLAAAISLPVHRLKPLEPILRFCYYDADSVCTIQPVNPNTASLEILLRIPGVDRYLARAIVQNRSMGPYRNLTHLQRRLSLSADTTAALMHYLRF